MSDPTLDACFTKLLNVLESVATATKNNAYRAFKERLQVEWKNFNIAINSSMTDHSMGASMPAEQSKRPLSPASNITIVFTSGEERFRAAFERPLAFRTLNDYLHGRQKSTHTTIFYEQQDLWRSIESQEDLDKALIDFDKSEQTVFKVRLALKATHEQSVPCPFGFNATTTTDGKKLSEVFDANRQGPKPPAEWREAACIGQGAHGRVMLCVDRETGDQLIVKKIYARGNEHAMKVKVQSLCEEVTILSRLKHDKVVRYLGVNVTDNCVNIFMEYMTAGSLYDEIHKYGKLPEQRAIKTTKQILRGLEYLHSLNVVHRDIKSANILRHASPADYKLSDFGSAQCLQASQLCTEYKSTPHYTAPEIVSDQPYSFKADIWSVGITIVEMLTCKTLYSETPSNAVLFRIAEGPVKYELPPEISPALKALIDKMLSQAPNDRPEISEILAMGLLSTA